MPVQSRESTLGAKARSYPARGTVPSSDALVLAQHELARREEELGHAPYGPLNGTLLAFGRMIFGGYFVYNGLNHFMNREMLTAYAASKQVPLPGMAVAVSGAMLLAGGLSLVAGARPKIGASLISGFLLGVSPIMHNFWQIDEEQKRMQELVNFTKNMALVGGTCLAAAVPEPWPASLDAATQ